MTGAVVLLAAAVPFFFLGVHRASRAGGLASVAWGCLSAFSLLAAGGAVLRLMVPGFFEGGF